MSQFQTFFFKTFLLPKQQEASKREEKAPSQLRRETCGAFLSVKPGATVRNSVVEGKGEFLSADMENLYNFTQIAFKPGPAPVNLVILLDHRGPDNPSEPWSIRPSR